MLQKEFAWFMTSAKKEKTKLRQFIVQWFGKDFQDEAAAQAFDFSKLLGQLAVLTVAHKPKNDGNMKNDIADIYLPTPEQRASSGTGYNKRICYEISMGQNEVFKELPEFLQKKIMESDEMRGIGRATAPPAPSPAPVQPPAAVSAPEEELAF